MDLAIGDRLQAKFACYTGNQLGLMIHHYDVKAFFGPGPITYFQAAIRLDVVFNAAIKALLSEKAKYLGVSTRRIHPAVGPEYPATLNSGYGSIVGDPLPHQVSGIITLRTEFVGRRERGRKYMPFPAEADNPAGGSPSPGYVAALQALGDLFASDVTVTVGLDTVTLGPVIHHRSVPAVPTAITSALARSKWATQRRRGDYGRPNDVPFGAFP